MYKYLIALFFVALVAPAKALKLPGFFGDGMVLQRNIRIPVWGWATPGEKVTVELNHHQQSTITGADGRWKLLLEKESMPGPFKLSVSTGKNSIEINDVLIGDVWVCSGQSNMELTVSSAMNAAAEISSAHYPLIRQIKIPNRVSGKPLDDILPAAWYVAVPENVGNFTAVGYFFARELFEKIHVPIGLINTTWGGTNVETWTSKEAFEKDGEFQSMIRSVPKLNLDSFAKEKSRKLLMMVMNLQHEQPGVNDNEWQKPSYSDKQWPVMALPSLWESRSLPNLDGVVWFRKHIHLERSQLNSDATLSLSMIDDNDQTYFNGVEVGKTRNYKIRRIYPIPANLLKEGDNVVSVRVEDTGGGGGIYGEPSDMYFGTGNNKVSLAGDWLYQVDSIYTGSNSVGPNSLPSLLFNAMIHPLIPFGIKGCLWYQGEANAGRAYQYNKAFPLMIRDWRSKWGEGNFPFYFVQLASFNAGNGNYNGSEWAELREAQQKTLALPATGMAVTTDIGNSTDIHPKNKQDAGKRLASIALHNLYGFKNIYQGPLFKSLHVSGNKAIISFTGTGNGLVIHNDRKLQGFAIAGKDHKFYPAEATLKNNMVIVYSPVVTDPVAVRYAWEDDAGEANLFNKDGFPAVPFRTDKWPGITQKEKYKIMN